MDPSEEEILILTDDSLKRVKFQCASSQGIRIQYRRANESRALIPRSSRGLSFESVEIHQQGKIFHIVFEGWNPAVEGLSSEMKGKIQNFIGRRGELNRIGKVVVVTGMRNLRGDLSISRSSSFYVRKIERAARGVIGVLDELRVLCPNAHLFYLGAGRLLENRLAPSQVGRHRLETSVASVNNAASELVREVAGYFKTIDGISSNWFYDPRFRRIRVIVTDAFLGIDEPGFFSNSGNHLSAEGALQLARMVKVIILGDEFRNLGYLVSDHDRQKYRAWFEQTHPTEVVRRPEAPQFGGGYGWNFPSPPSNRPSARREPFLGRFFSRGELSVSRSVPRNNPFPTSATRYVGPPPRDGPSAAQLRSRLHEVYLNVLARYELPSGPSSREDPSREDDWPDPVGEGNSDEELPELIDL